MGRRNLKENIDGLKESEGIYRWASRNLKECMDRLKEYTKMGLKNLWMVYKLTG